MLQHNLFICDATSIKLLFKTFMFHEKTCAYDFSVNKKKNKKLYLLSNYTLMYNKHFLLILKLMLNIVSPLTILLF